MHFGISPENPFYNTSEPPRPQSSTISNAQQPLNHLVPENVLIALDQNPQVTSTHSPPPIPIPKSKTPKWSANEVRIVNTALFCILIVFDMILHETNPIYRNGDPASFSANASYVTLIVLTGV